MNSKAGVRHDTYTAPLPPITLCFSLCRVSARGAPLGHQRSDQPRPRLRHLVQSGAPLRSDGQGVQTKLDLGLHLLLPLPYDWGGRLLRLQ